MTERRTLEYLWATSDLSASQSSGEAYETFESFNLLLGSVLRLGGHHELCMCSAMQKLILKQSRADEASKWMRHFYNLPSTQAGTKA